MDTMKFTNEKSRLDEKAIFKLETNVKSKQIT